LQYFTTPLLQHYEGKAIRKHLRGWLSPPFGP
jgi:hypothetical protein